MESSLAGPVVTDGPAGAATLAPDGFHVRGVRVAPNVVLAPMSGITDSAYRSVVKELNPGAVGLVVTEFVSIEALARHNLRTHHMLRYRETERPLSMQLFGSEPPRMAEAALIAQDLGADIIDVNCGCPVPKVVRKGGGAELMRRPGILREILATLRRSLTIPFTLKIRAGWDDDSRNAVEIARMAEGEGAAMIAVHARTRVQLYTGLADWSLTARVKEAVGVPVIGSGDVVSARQAVERMRETGVDGIMIGRGSLGHPWIFREIAALRAGREVPPVHPLERFAAIDALMVRLAEELPPKAAFGRGRGLACRMLKTVRGGAALREALTRAPTLPDMRALLHSAADAYRDGTSETVAVAC